MPSDRATRALYDIRGNALLAEEFVGDLTPAVFAADRRTLCAVMRCLEIVSEASRRLPQDMRNRDPGLPWRAIMDLDNFYRHVYEDVAETFVWRTVRHSLMHLLAAVDAEIANLPATPEADEAR